MSVGIGYTLATECLFCRFDEFHAWSEELLGRPIFTHEFANESLWKQLRETFERQVLYEQASAGRSSGEAVSATEGKGS